MYFIEMMMETIKRSFQNSISHTHAYHGTLFDARKNVMLQHRERDNTCTKRKSNIQYENKNNKRSARTVCSLESNGSGEEQ